MIVKHNSRKLPTTILVIIIASNGNRNSYYYYIISCPYNIIIPKLNYINLVNENLFNMLYSWYIGIILYTIYDWKCLQQGERIHDCRRDENYIVGVPTYMYKVDHNIGRWTTKLWKKT